MKAVVFRGTLKVELEDRPISEIVDQTDAIVGVRYVALCGKYRVLIAALHQLFR